MFVRNRQYGAPRMERGFTLLELLVAMTLFAIGMLALSALQGSALKFNSDSYQRSQAVVLAMGMADRMRANLQAVNNGNINDYAAIASPPVAVPTCIGAICGASAMAQFDAFEWLTDVQQLLPNGIGSVACNDSDPADGDPCTDVTSTYTITVSWAGKFGHPSYSVTFRP